MAVVFVLPSLEKEIDKKFKKESIDIFSLMYSLEGRAKKGKLVGKVGDVAVKEIKYKRFRFYFIIDNHKVKFLSADELKDLFIKFVRMSDKKEQHETIEEIKHILRNLGEEGF
ncbi:MAG: hypothetical protein ACQEP1_01675 [Nanobdellota archaeon]